MYKGVKEGVSILNFLSRRPGVILSLHQFAARTVLRGRLMILAGGLCALSARTALANVAVTPASGRAGVLADSAQNGVQNVFTVWGDIVIQEGTASDFTAQNNKTIVLTLPAGWRFNAGVGTASSSKDSGTGANELVVNS